MRFVALAFVLLSLPVFLALLRQHPHRRPWAFAALAASLFIAGELRIDATLYGWPLWNGVARGMEISPTDMLAIALIATRRPTRGALPFWGVIGFYGATLLVSVFVASVPVASLFVVWQFARMLLLFAAIGGECDRPELRSGLLAGLPIGLLIQAAYVVQQKASGVVQATGTLFHQNVLGLLTELALLPLLAALLAGDRRKLVIAGVLAALVIIAGGGSRGAISIAGGGAIVLLILSIARGMTPAKARVTGLAALAIAIAAPMAMLTLKDRFGDRSITVQDDQRPAFERAARAMAADHPLGVGANLYVPTANTEGYADRAGVAWNFANRSAPVHNAYLLARAETGWAGEIALILMLVVPLLRGLRFAFANRRGPAGEIALGCAVALGVNIVHNNFEFAVFSYNVLSLIFVSLGLIAAQLRGARLAKRGTVPGNAGARRPGVPRWAPGRATAALTGAADMRTRAPDASA